MFSYLLVSHIGHPPHVSIYMILILHPLFPPFSPSPIPKFPHPHPYCQAVLGGGGGG